MYTCHWSRCVLKFLYFWPLPNKCPVPAFQHIKHPQHPNVNNPTTDTISMTDTHSTVDRRIDLQICAKYLYSNKFRITINLTRKMWQNLFKFGVKFIWKLDLHKRLRFLVLWISTEWQFLSWLVQVPVIKVSYKKFGGFTVFMSFCLRMTFLSISSVMSEGSQDISMCC